MNISLTEKHILDESSGRISDAKSGATLGWQSSENTFVGYDPEFLEAEEIEEIKAALIKLTYR